MLEKMALEKKFQHAGIKVTIQRDSRHWKLHAPNGAIVGFWPNTGTCWAFGKSFKPSIDNLINALTAGRIAMPSKAQEAHCRSCDATIYWIKTDKGKNMPLDTSGEPHWQSCPNANKHRSSGP